MSAIVVSSDSPVFQCQSPACYIDAESIDTSYVYDSEYASSCDVNPTITVIGGGSDGADGTDGSDGRGIESIIRTSGYGSAGTTDTYTITYTDATTSTFNVYNGADGAQGDQGDPGLQGDPGADGSPGADGTDGATIRTGTADPNDTQPGNNGDLYFRTNTYDLYQKVAGSYGTPISNLKGDTGSAGSDGVDGSDGDVWSYGATIPTDITVNTYNEYYILTTNNNVYYKELGTRWWTLITNFNGDTYYTTSSTSITLSSVSIGDTINIVTSDSTLSYSIGQFLVIANSTNDYFTGKVLSYSGTALAVEVLYIKQTTAGALTSWEINLAGITESESLPDWYEITATAGTGTIASRVFTGPSGWSIGAANTISVTGLSSSTLDLTIKHNTGFSTIDCVVFASDGNKYTKLQIPVSYSTLYSDLTDVALQLASFCTLTQALKIFVKLV